MSSADDMSKYWNFLKNFQKSNFYYHIWIQHEKCIQMSTNKPLIGPVVFEMSSLILREKIKF